MPVDAGTVLAGKYRLEKRLGRGGMGEVWSAHDRELDRPVAVKIVLADLGSDPAMIIRLRREARTAARLQHPGITSVYDIGEHDRHPFFVMELLAGTDFKALIDAHPGGLPIERVLALMAPVADALDHAHRKGVVHRDIKPANLMEMAEGGVKICDFGISRYADATTGLTSPGGLLGTPAYMAPEQYEGHPADAASDLYSFGATLHTLLAGQPPFPGPSLATLMRQHLNEPPPRLTPLRADAPAQLEHLILRLLAKEPSARPASAADAAAELRTVAASPPTPRTPRTPTTRPNRPSPQTPTEPSPQPAHRSTIAPRPLTTWLRRAAGLLAIAAAIVLFIGSLQESSPSAYRLVLPPIALIAGICAFLPWTRTQIGPGLIAAAGFAAIPNIVYCLRQMPKSPYNSDATYQAYIRMEMTGSIIVLTAALLVTPFLILILNRLATSTRLPTP
jgi:serine/threonine protein kinase